MIPKKLREGVYKFSFNTFGSYVYLIKDKKLLIDTSSKINKPKLIEYLKSLNINPEDIKTILLTHTHWDHIGNLEAFPNATLYSYKNIKKFNDPEIKPIETPGHTQDSLCFLYKDILFSGDTIFDKNRYGRTDLPGGSEEQLKESLQKLKNINYNILAPGHL